MTLDDRELKQVLTKLTKDLKLKLIKLRLGFSLVGGETRF